MWSLVALNCNVFVLLNYSGVLVLNYNLYSVMYKDDLFESGIDKL